MTRHKIVAPNQESYNAVLLALEGIDIALRNDDRFLLAVENIDPNLIPKLQDMGVRVQLDHQYEPDELKARRYNFTLDEVRAVKETAMDAFKGLCPDALVRGIGITSIGEGYGLKINLESKPVGMWPTEVNGVPVVFEVVGNISKE